MGRIAYDQKLDTLLAGAARVFAERGFHQTSMRDLSRLTGVSLAGWYYYVASKDELLCAIQERAYAALTDAVARALDGASSPVERLERFVHAHLAFATRRADEMRLLAREERALSGDLAARVGLWRRAHARSLDAVLSGLDGAGRVQVTRELGVRARFGIMTALGDGDAADVADCEPLATEVVRLFLGGYLGAGEPAYPSPSQMAAALPA